jgi:hypothetical protein
MGCPTGCQLNCLTGSSAGLSNELPTRCLWFATPSHNTNHIPSHTSTQHPHHIHNTITRRHHVNSHHIHNTPSHHTTSHRTPHHTSHEDTSHYTITRHHTNSFTPSHTTYHTSHATPRTPSLNTHQHKTTKAPGVFSHRLALFLLNLHCCQLSRLQGRKVRYRGARSLTATVNISYTTHPHNVGTSSAGCKKEYEEQIIVEIVRRRAK